MLWAVTSDQWDKNYQETAAYYYTHRKLLVLQLYVSKNGIKLGCWIGHLRMARRRSGKGSLTEEQIQRLNLIGMAWDAEEERWQIGLNAARDILKHLACSGSCSRSPKNGTDNCKIFVRALCFQSKIIKISNQGYP